MAACGALSHIASDVGRIAGGPAAAAARMLSVLKLRVGAGTARGVRGKVQSLSVSRAVATDFGASAAAGDDDEEETMLLRRGDSYFAIDSRPIVLFDGIIKLSPESCDVGCLFAVGGWICCES